MRSTGLTLALLFAVVMAIDPPAAIAGNPKLINGQDEHWVVRRNQLDPSPNNDVAYVVKITKQDQSPLLEADLWAYNGVNLATKRYVQRAGYPVTLTEDASHNGRGTVFRLDDGGMIHTLGIVIDRRKQKNGNGNWRFKNRRFSRVQMRYTTVSKTSADADGKKKKVIVIACPEVPTDDVLEEETLPDDPNTTPPEYPPL